jgi:Ca-activated chloride channel family protein
LPEGGFLHDPQGDMVLAARDDASLDALARAGGGIHLTMRADHGDIDALHAQLRSGTASRADGQRGAQWQDRGPWLLLPLLLVVATAFRRGWIMLVLLACLPLLPRTAQAGTWQNLWQRPDQQAAQALRDGHPRQAHQLARDPAWRGVAAYRAGDYAGAADALQHAPGSDAAYNRGNALARARQYRQAIEAYDEALKLDPANADAKANRQAVEDWLKRQSKQQKSPSPGAGQNPSEQNKPGDDKPGEEKSGQNKSGQNKSGENPSGQDASGKSPPSSDAGKNDQSSGDDGTPDKPEPRTAQQRAEQKAQAEQAQRALKEQMDQALANDASAKSKPPATHQLGTLGRDDPQSKLPADLRHALQRVQDDPGGLLRRKFELEYRERHDGAPEDGQP